jgi:F-type H+-transporting ATPase subunit b
LKSRVAKKRFFPCLLRPVLAALLVLSVAPVRAAAQAGSGAGTPANASASAAGTPSEKPTQSEEDQEKALLHSPMVQGIARILHLDVDTATYIFLAINFTVIFFAIVIPLVRMMPKILRKRRETLSQNLNDARTATADANARLSAVEAKLSGLDEEMKKFRAQIEQESLEDEKQIKASIGEETARIVQSAEQEIGVSAAAAKRELRSFAAGLAIEHAEKQLTLTAETDRALIAEFVASVGGENGAGKGGNN